MRSSAFVLLSSPSTSFSLRWRLRASPFLCYSSANTNNNNKEDLPTILFMGTPRVAANTLKQLVDGEKRGRYKVIAVVTQPPAKVGRQNRLTPSDTHVLSQQLQIPVFVPEKLSEEGFLKEMEALSPSLVVTAAFGKHLPTKFLRIPSRGTVNIHPSLLPRYRGAAPVQRCLENGDTVTGVCVLRTVKEMDAGPILATERVVLSGHETSSELLPRLFAQGTALLLSLLPRLFAGSCPETPQATEGVSQAPKLEREDGHVRFATLSARQVYNKCRAFKFSDWPGVFADFQVDDLPPFRLKINRTVVLREAPTRGMSEPLEEQQLQREKNANRTVTFLPLSKALVANNCNSDSTQLTGCNNSNTDARSDSNSNISGQDSSLNNSRQQEWCMQLTCGDGSVLGILEVQPVNKKVMRVKDFLNGFHGKQIAFRFCE